MNDTSFNSLLIATLNPGKLREFKDMLTDAPLNFQTLQDFDEMVEVEEVGNSFKENAILKAKGYAVQTGLVTLADDSGLEVSALGGAPGVLSARYAGASASDADRVNKLLEELSFTRDPHRRARFVCVIAIFDSRTERIDTFKGTCEGRIAIEPSGNNGFGYDPIFIPDGHSESFASLSTAVKHEISHRGQALRAAGAYIRGLISGHA